MSEAVMTQAEIDAAIRALVSVAKTTGATSGQTVTFSDGGSDFPVDIP